MRLNLKDIIDIPGAGADFAYDPAVSDLAFDGIVGYDEPLHVEGTVRNTAGVLTLRATETAKLRCVCARCLAEFSKPFVLPVEVTLADEVQDEDETDIYLLDGDYIDLDEPVVTEFVLNMDQIQLCSEDCKGLCPKCGKNLNEGPCSCTAEKDPRLAVLGRLLEN